MRLTSTRARRAVAASVAAVMLGTTALVVVPSATADPGKTIEQVRAELAELEMRAESASEEYSAAQDKLARISEETDDAQREVDAAKKEVAASQEVIGAIAAAAYQTGGMDAGMQLLLAEEPEEFLAQAAALDQVASSQATALRRAATTRLRLAQATSRLEAKQSEQADAVEQADARRSEIESAVSDTETYLNQLQEEERQRLAELAAAEAAASAAAAAQAAAALEDNGGNGGNPANGAEPAGSNGAGAGGANGTGSASNGAGSGGANGTGSASNGAGGGGANGTGAGSNAAGSSGATSSGDYSARAAIAVRYALAQVGEPYSYSANPPNSWDCSKLTAWAWAQAGVSLTAYSYAQADQVRRVSTSELQPGDILFYFRGAHHVAMYIGGGKLVEASSPSVGVRVTDVWNSWASAHFSFAGRPI